MCYLIFGFWVIYDARKRKNNAIIWPITTVLFGLIALPVYLAKRNLMKDEVREGGVAWNIIRYFAIFWTLSMAIITFNGVNGISELTGQSDSIAILIGETVAFGAYAFIWFGIIVVALILGQFLKRNIIEKGPTGNLTG